MNKDVMAEAIGHRRVLHEDSSPVKFFALTTTLTVPFWCAGFLVESPSWVPMEMPISALMFACPMVAVELLERSQGRRKPILPLVKAAFSYQNSESKLWYLPVFLTPPAITVVAYGAMRLTGLPPQAQLPPPETLLLFAVYFAAAIAEEVGWTGYALGPLQRRWGALNAGVLLGLMWAAWHVPAWLAVHDPAWTAQWFVFTVAARVLIVWLGDNTGRPMATAVLFHAMINTVMSTFPAYGSPRAPLYIATVTLSLAAAVSLLWDPRTLTRPRSFFKHLLRRRAPNRRLISRNHIQAVLALRHRTG